jgi:hypothetical protein
MAAAVQALFSPEEAEQVAKLSPEEKAKYDYLKAQVMPTLGTSLRALLRERERRQAKSPGTPPPFELVPLNPLNYVAQHMMRHNPNASTGLPSDSASE